MPSSESFARNHGWPISGSEIVHYRRLAVVTHPWPVRGRLLRRVLDVDSGELGMGGEARDAQRFVICFQELPEAEMPVPVI